MRTRGSYSSTSTSQSGTRSSSKKRQISKPNRESVQSKRQKRNVVPTQGPSRLGENDSQIQEDEDRVTVEHCEGTDYSSDLDVSFAIGSLEIETATKKIQEVISSRNRGRICPRSRKAVTPKVRKPVLPADKKEQSIRSNWINTLRVLKSLKSDFFCSEQATMSEITELSKGKNGYQAIPLDQHNNSDIQSIFDLDYSMKAKANRSMSGYSQLVSTAGQYMRVCVVRGLSDLSEMYRSGEVFRAVCDPETINFFLDFYRASSSGMSTVLTKAQNLKKVTEHACIFFRAKEPHTHTLAERCIRMLAKVCKELKVDVRNQTRNNKDLNSRISAGRVLFPEDFRDCAALVRRSLDGIMESFQLRKVENGRKAAKEMLGKTDLLRKWSLNLLLVLIFSAAGQRPEAYAKLQCPDRQEIKELKRCINRKRFFDLRICPEKTRRSERIPNVLVPQYVLRYIEFHVEHVRDLIIKRNNVDESGAQYKPLLMHTETGDDLNSRNVNSSLKAFWNREYPERKEVTTMSLRSSYGTMMMHAYRQKKVFSNLTETAFLDVLPQVMNTSAEQLRQTYIALDETDYEETAKELMKTMEV